MRSNGYFDAVMRRFLQKQTEKSAGREVVVRAVERRSSAPIIRPSAPNNLNEIAKERLRMGAYPNGGWCDGITSLRGVGIVAFVAYPNSKRRDYWRYDHQRQVRILVCEAPPRPPRTLKPPRRMQVTRTVTETVRFGR